LKDEPVDRQVLKEHEDLFENLDHEEISKEITEPKTYIISPGRFKKGNYDYVNIEEIPQEAEEESLSLEDKEKELIVKALKKNNNKRKYAAKDLGISERTLYRKIKQYEIDE